MQELRPLGAQQKVWNIRWDELTDKSVTSGDLVEPSLRVASRNIKLQLRDLDLPATYDARIRDLEARRVALEPHDVEGRRRIMEQHTQLTAERGVAANLRPGGPHYIHPEIQAIRLGAGCAILGLPGEFFVETAQRIQAEAGIPHLLIACYANHYIYYVVPAHEYAKGGYEAGATMLTEEAEDTVRSEAVTLLREVMS